MNYIEIIFQLNKPRELNADLLISYLSDIGFEGFEERKKVLLAYIDEDKLNLENLKQEHISSTYSSYTQKKLEEQNWNKVWEENYFQAIEINADCIIRADFHQIKKSYKYDILIHPQMSFGTGHHSTTLLIAQKLFELDLKEMSVLDMGCGTGILAILAAKLGANPIYAIDNDKWAYENSLENVKLNHTSDIKVAFGDANLLDSKEKYQVILSNINLNINLENIPYYAMVAAKSSLLLLSGFYTEDIPEVEKLCKSLGYKLLETKAHKNWAILVYQYIN